MEPISPKASTENLFDKIPIVSPLVRRVEALEFTDPQIPGDIKVDAQGKLLKTWIEYESILGSHIETFDNWVINIIPKQLASRPIRIPQGEVTVTNPIFFPPRISTSDNNWIPLTPQLARDNGYTYSSELYADFVLNAGTPQEERLPQSFLGKIPVMLGSVLCHLKGKTDKERMEMGECPSDPLGYFIIKGSEKIVLMQEKLRTDRIFLYHPSTKDAVVCKMTCSTITGSTNVTIALGKKSKALKIHLAFMGRSKGKTNKIGNTVSVFQIYRMLGMKDPNQILQMISLFTKKEYIKKIWVQLQPTFVKLGQVGDDIEHISRKKGLGNIDYGIKQASIMKDLKNELFPQVPPENTTQKLYMLSIMVARYAEYMIGERQLDDRDNWGNKRVENAARSLEQLFGNIWKESILKAQDTIDTKGLQGLQSVKREINPSFIADNFVSSFNSNNWGVQGSYMPKENITDNLKRDSIAAVYSHLTKLNTPANRRAKQSKVRMVQMSQLGFVCAVETPEGEQCGLVKNTAITAYMSIERGENVIIEHIAKYISKLPTEQLPTPVMLNGKFMGWCAGASLRDFCVTLRRRSIFYKDTAIVLARDGFLYIFSDAARPTRPLLIVDPENQELVIKNKDLWTADMKTLMDEGCVEYIDAYEQEYIQLAQMMDDIDARNAELAEATRNHQEAIERLSQAEQAGDRKTIEDAKEMVSQAANTLKDLQEIPVYTHCELDPTATMGIAASLVPLANHNQGPRNTYQASMAKQALGIYHSQHAARFDTTSKCLAYPSRPLFQTQMDEIVGLNELPAGEEVVVAVMTYTGYNQEDALIMNQAAIDRGLFRQVIYKSYKTVQKRTRSTVEEFARPQVRKDEPPERYAAIDENGIARLGSFVREGDCLIGKIRKNITTGKVENASSYVGVGQEGIVDKVLVSTNPEGMRVVKVKLRQIRKPIMGDKFASRYAQKATLGLILPQEDMPFTASGMIPDIIINPHCFPAATPVSTGFGYSRKIGSFSAEGKESVWGWDEVNNTMKMSTSMGMEPKGYKDVINVYLEDGRIIKCTPDHRFMTVEFYGDKPLYKWVEAKDFRTGSVKGRISVSPSKVVCGLDMPMDEPELDEGSNWVLDTAEYTFDMKTYKNREKTLAFARLLGLILTDGCISERDDLTHGFASTACLGHEIDVISFIRDIELVTGKSPKPTLSKGVWNVRVPASLAGSIGKLKGVQSGKRSRQVTTWPEFIMDKNCPKSVLREFLAGLFGGDGHAPHIIDRKEIDGGATFLVECKFSQTCMEEFTLALKTKMQDLIEMLSRLDVNSKIETVREKKPNEDSFDSMDGIPRYEVRIKLETNTQFSDKIGFRYCIQKSCRLAAAASYWRFQQRVVEQHDWVVNRTNEIYESGKARKSLQVALDMAREELKHKEPVLNGHYSLSNLTDIRNRRSSPGSRETLTRFVYNEFPDAAKFLKEANCLKWFEREGKSPDYIVKRGSMEIPGFFLNVIGTRSAGKEMVYDIGVNDIHSFLAHGSVVHNCLPSRMTIGKMIEIVTSKVAAFSGERVNATAFRKFDVKTFSENLVQYGYSPSGKERLYSGFTGKPLEAMIFIGPCFYQVLRHHVLDKIQMRAKGAIKQLSHQPVGGRAIKGGQRFGEMERDAIISHGASAFLQERLCTVSDAYQAVYCSKCGTIAIANHTSDKFVCRSCKEGATFGTCTIPYAYKLLTHMLAGAGFNLEFDMTVENSNERPVIPLGANGPSINAAGVCTPHSVSK